MKKYCYTCMEEIKQGDFCTNCMKQNEEDCFAHHLKPGTVLNNKYLVGNCLGEGGFGITYIGRDLMLDIKVAIKEYYPNGYVNRNNDATQMVTTTTTTQSDFFNKGKERFLQEARNIAKFIGETGIVGVREYFECNNTAYIIMDYLEGENLSVYSKKNGVFKPETIFELMLPIVRSLRKIHDEGIIHRDISPDNIMFMKNGTLKLMDFGSARFFTNEEKEMSVMLKQGYAPEEQYRKNGDQGPWTDVYGLCATIYKCITGITPVNALDRLASDSIKEPNELGIDIPKPLEIVLMYGLAVFKNNRCKDMVELEDLIIKALNKQSVTIDNTPAESDLYKTQAADDDFYKTQIAEEVYNTPNQTLPPSPSFPTAGSNGSVSYTAKTSRNNNKTIIIISIALAALLVTSGICFFIVSKIFNENSKKSNDSSSPSQEEIVVEDENHVPSCINKEHSKAKTELEKLGLIVEEEYEFSDSVNEEHVISQSLKEGYSFNKGDIIKLVVSKGKDVCPYEYSQKLTVTAFSSWPNGTATLYEWKNGDWSELARYNCMLGSKGIGPAKEGSSYTPQGLHRMGVVLSAYTVNTSLNTYNATRNTGVVDDVNSEFYNRILESSQVPSGVSFDNIGSSLTDGTTYAMIYIEHNGSGFSSSNVVKGNGSAIGIRGQYGTLNATYGDVDISADDMVDLLSKIDVNKNPMVEIKVK